MPFAVGADPLVLGNFRHPLDALVAHELAADIGALQKGAIVVVAGAFFLVFGARGRGVGVRFPRRLEVGDLGVALEHLEACRHRVDAVVNRLQLGALVDHVFRRRDLAAIVQPRRGVQLVALLLGQIEFAERAGRGLAGGVGQHLGQQRHPRAVAAGVGRLGVDRRGDQLDERIQQLFLALKQHLVVDRHRRLAGQRLDRRLDLRRERGHGAALGLARVEQLHHADDVVMNVLHRNGEEGLRAVAGLDVERPGAGKIEPLGLVGIRDVDRFSAQRRVGGDVAVIGLAGLGVIHGQGRKRDFALRSAAQREVQRIRAHDLEFQAVVVGAQIQAAAVGVGDVLGVEQNPFQQPVEVLLRRQRDANFVERLEASGALGLGLAHRAFAQGGAQPRLGPERVDRAHQEIAYAGVHIDVDFVDLLFRQDADHRHRRQGGIVFDFGQQGVPVQVRIAKVEKHHVEVARAQPRHRRRLGDELGGAALAAQHLDRAAPGGARAIHDQRRFLVVAQTPLPLGACSLA